ncbi:MAG: dienelactone hydrolase family protein [Methylovirgula sp.]|nr:dienelactone hydrolase family protein [Methylovirgula sp.]
MLNWIKLTAKDGVTIGAYEAAPEGRARGGLVVLQEIFGVNRHIRNVADDFAARGYHVVAPALFDRVEPGVELGYESEDAAKGIAIRAKTKLADTLADIAAAVDAARPFGRVGIVGYCWGGTLAFAAAQHVEGLAAAVGYYGSGIAALPPDRPCCPVMLYFGDQDKSIPLSDIEKIRRTYPEITTYIYPANHGFNCTDRAAYDPASATLARQRTLDFFAQYL